MSDLDRPTVALSMPPVHTRTETVLPEGWARHHTDTGQKYYANTQTRETQWAPPTTGVELTDMSNPMNKKVGVSSSRAAKPRPLPKKKSGGRCSRDGLCCRYSCCSRDKRFRYPCMLLGLVVLGLLVFVIVTVVQLLPLLECSEPGTCLLYTSPSPRDS